MSEAGRVRVGTRRSSGDRNRDPAVAALLPTAQRTLARVGRTFAFASLLLPRDVREDVELLYLVLRSLDDLVDREADGAPEAEQRLAAVEAWAGADRGDAGTSRETLILDDLARRHPGLPREAIHDFTRGMRADLEGPRIASERALDDYAYLVAGTVGRLMAAILGGTGPEVDRAARALGIAMQRTNILRDLDEDLARGRVYIPAATLAAHGLSGASFAVADRRAMLVEEIERADAAYDEGMRGIPLLPHGRRSIRAAALMYREILRQVERDGYGRIRPHRAVVPRWRRLALVARAVIGR